MVTILFFRKLLVNKKFALSLRRPLWCSERDLQSWLPGFIWFHSQAWSPTLRMSTGNGPCALRSLGKLRHFLCCCLPLLFDAFGCNANKGFANFHVDDWSCRGSEYSTVQIWWTCFVGETEGKCFFFCYLTTIETGSNSSQVELFWFNTIRLITVECVNRSRRHKLWRMNSKNWNKKEDTNHKQAEKCMKLTFSIITILQVYLRKDKLVVRMQVKLLL